MINAKQNLNVSASLSEHLNRTVKLPETDYIAMELDYDPFQFHFTDNYEIIFTQSGTFPKHNLVIQFVSAGTVGIVDVIKITAAYLSTKNTNKDEDTVNQQVFATPSSNTCYPY